MKLLAIQFGLWCLFIVVTARVGVFLVPFGSLSGIAITTLSPNAALVVKVACVLAGLVCLSMFVYGIRNRRTWRGIVINVAGLYGWCFSGYLALFHAS